MVVLEVIFLLSKILINPSVVKVSLIIYFIWKIFVLFLHLFCNRKEIYGCLLYTSDAADD